MSFVVAYVSIAWLLKFVSHHSIARFVPYRIAVGLRRHRPAGHQRAVRDRLTSASLALRASRTA